MPFRFSDLPAEVRTIIYNHALIETGDQIDLDDVIAPEVSEAFRSLLVSKMFSEEAAPILYGGYLFCFDRVWSAMSWLSKIGKRNASHVKLLNLGNLWYDISECRALRCSPQAAIIKAAGSLGSGCAGLQLLDFKPVSSDIAVFDEWDDDAFEDVKGLTVALPWLSYVSYDCGGGDDGVRMTSIAQMQVEGENIPFDVDEEIKKREKARKERVGEAD